MTFGRFIKDKRIALGLTLRPSASDSRATPAIIRSWSEGS